MSDRYIVHGAQNSYYTGKIEAYLRAKGLPYRLAPFSPSTMNRCARHTGVMQIPQIECPDGTWLVDTTPTIAYFERTITEPSLTPTDPALAFLALLLEDYADEWLWRPAMHYRWSFRECAVLNSFWLAEHLDEVRTPRCRKRLWWRVRQTAVFVRGDGITARTRAAAEQSYLDALDGLQIALERRPYILGERPTQADFGYFAPMFRHFFCDPTPGRIMRDRAPAVLEWVARMWNTAPARLRDTMAPDTILGDLGPLLSSATAVYLPYLAANERVHAAGLGHVRYRAQGVDWSEPTKPYRVWCLDQLRRSYRHLTADARATVDQALGSTEAVAILAADSTGPVPQQVCELPVPADAWTQPVDSWWRRR